MQRMFHEEKSTIINRFVPTNNLKISAFQSDRVKVATDGNIFADENSFSKASRNFSGSVYDHVQGI